MFNIAHIIPYIGKAQGGPVLSMADMTAALAANAIRPTVVTASRPTDGEPASFDEGVSVEDFQGSRFGMFRYIPAMTEFLAEGQFDLIHSHGLWTYPSYAAGVAARRKGIPHVLATCGMLQRGARRRSSLKKRLCRLLFQDRVLRDATCLHAKSEAEYEGLRDFGLTNPVAIIPNPVSLPTADAQTVSPEELVGRFPCFQKKTLLFLGRIHPVKGLRRLISAWNELAEFHDTWNLVLVGPDEGGHKAELESQITTLDIKDSIVFTGPLDNPWKWSALQACDLFVMPSDFENFGSAIAEAMMMGKPVVTTTGTPWSNLKDAQAGWWVSPTADALATALKDAMLLTDADRSEMGACGSAIAEAFSPTAVATQLIQVYQWCVDSGASPECLRLEG